MNNPSVQSSPSQGYSLPQNSECDAHEESDITLEKSVGKPILFDKFRTRSKVQLEKDTILQE